jgi:hypothetical protein
MIRESATHPERVGKIADLLQAVRDDLGFNPKIQRSKDTVSAANFVAENFSDLTIRSRFVTGGVPDSAAVQEIGYLAGTQYNLAVTEALFVVLDHAFERTVGHIGIPGLQQAERGEHTAQASVAVLEWVDLKKHHRIDGDDEQRMKPLNFLGFPEPSDKVSHQPGCVKGRRGLEDAGNLLAGIIEGCDTVRQHLVLAAMPVVLFAVAQKIAVELLDVVFCDRNLRPRMKDGFHDLGVSSDLLLVAGGEGFDLQIGEHALYAAVGYPPRMSLQLHLPCSTVQSVQASRMGKSWRSGLLEPTSGR